MKYSAYNACVEYKGHIVFCNTITLGYVVLTRELHSNVETLSLDELSEVHPSLYASFVEKGLVIDEAIDELSVLRDIELNSDFSSDEYHLIVNPTLDCNFQCWYCFENKNRGSVMSDEVLQRTKRHISKMIEEQKPKKFTLSFFGGEPLLYYKKIAKPLILALNEYKDRVVPNIHFTTNGFLLTERLILEMEQLGVSSLQITLDGDKDYHDRTRFDQSGGSFDRIMENIQLAILHNIEVVARFNYTRENIGSIFSVVERLSRFQNKERIMFSPNRVWQDAENNDADGSIGEEIDRINSFVKESGMKLMPRKFQVALSNSCYADKKCQALVNYDGGVFKCNARDFTEDRRMGWLEANGEIHWNEKEEVWMRSKLEDPICLKCFVLPICGAGCRRIMFDSRGKHFCLYNDDPKRKEALLLGVLQS